MEAVQLSTCERICQYIASQDISSLTFKIAIPAIAAAGACFAVMTSSFIVVPVVALSVATLSFFDVYFFGNGKDQESLHFLAIRVMVAVAIIGGLAIGTGVGIMATGFAIPLGGIAITAKAFWNIVLLKITAASFAFGGPLTIGYKLLQTLGQMYDRFEQFKNIVGLIRAQVGNYDDFFSNVLAYFTSLYKSAHDLKTWDRPEIAFISAALQNDSELEASEKSAIVAQAYSFLSPSERKYFLSLLRQHVDLGVFEAILSNQQLQEARGFLFANPFAQEGVDEDLATLEGAAAIIAECQPLQEQIVQLQNPAADKLEDRFVVLQGEMQQLLQQYGPQGENTQIPRVRELRAQIKAVREQMAAEPEVEEDGDGEQQLNGLQAELLQRISPIVSAYQRMCFRKREYELLAGANQLEAQAEHRVKKQRADAFIAQLSEPLQSLRQATESTAKMPGILPSIVPLLNRGLRNEHLFPLRPLLEPVRNPELSRPTFEDLANKLRPLGITSERDLATYQIFSANEELPPAQIVARIGAFLRAPMAPARFARLAEPQAALQSPIMVKIKQVAYFVLNYVISPLFLAYQIIFNLEAIILGAVIGLIPFDNFSEIGYLAHRYVVFPEYTNSTTAEAVRKIFLQSIYALIVGVEKEGFGVFTGVALGVKVRQAITSLYDSTVAWLNRPALENQPA